MLAATTEVDYADVTVITEVRKILNGVMRTIRFGHLTVPAHEQEAAPVVDLATISVDISRLIMTIETTPSRRVRDIASKALRVIQLGIFNQRGEARADLRKVVTDLYTTLMDVYVMAIDAELEQIHGHEELKKSDFFDDAIKKLLALDSLRLVNTFLGDLRWVDSSVYVSAIQQLGALHYKNMNLIHPTPTVLPNEDPIDPLASGLGIAAGMFMVAWGYLKLKGAYKKSRAVYKKTKKSFFDTKDDDDDDEDEDEEKKLRERKKKLKLMRSILSD